MLRPAIAILLAVSFAGSLVHARPGADSAVAAPTAADTFLFEPENFVALGPWQRTGTTIQSSNMPATAFAGIRIEQAGIYRLWTRSQDFPAAQPGTRRFLLKIDEQPADRESGAHGQEGWHWEHVGDRELDSGVHLLEIEDTARFYGRLEAILVTRSNFDPNTLRRDELNRFATEPVQPVRVKPTEPAPPPAASDAATLAKLTNADVHIRFLAVRTASGQSRVSRDVRFVAAGGGSDPESVDAGVEDLLLIQTEDNRVSFDAYFPSWKGDAQTDWDLAGRRLRRPADARDPFESGTLVRLHPVDVRQVGADSVEITYRSADGLQASAVWQLPARGYAVKMSATLRTPADAFYSLAFGVGRSIARDEIAAVQLPPLYQFRRLPDSPVMITSSLMPHMLALVENVDGVTTGVIADPAGISQEWATRSNATYGFSLVDAVGDARPHIFAPILGGEGSRRARGEKLQADWWIVGAPQPWTEVMRSTDLDLYSLTDYREPVSTSLTDQALNIIDFMKDDEASGWDELLKGPANIEGPRTVTHAAPLMYASVARLTRDGDFFERRARPALEYALSRPGSHFALTAEGNVYVTQATARLSLENVVFGSAVWQGFDDLTDGLNPWLRDFARKNGEVLKPRNNSAEPAWSGQLALYRQRPDDALLARICRDVDSWIERVFSLNTTATRGIQPFHNVSFYPYWWDLVDLHDLTGEDRYLEAALRGAWQTVAGQWVTPPVQPGDTTLYPGDRHSGSYLVWWKDQDRFRLGWPAMTGNKHNEAQVPVTFDLSEKTVPAWTVSRVGLAVEQPISYFTAANNMGNIQLISWAANLLRLYGKTGDGYWRTFARNAVIGRGASYPGYYLSDYTDLVQSPDYTRKGPDITGFYWHHVPVHLAMIVDYLFTDAEVRTGGQVRFPYSKQQGYVWFTNRVYGGKPGRVFDDTECWPWLDRTKFRVDTPKVDFFGARSRKQFHLVLLNQSKADINAPVVLNYAALGISPKAGPLLRTSAGAKRLDAIEEGRFSVDLPQGAYAVLTFPAADEEVWPDLPPVSEGELRTTLGGAWGETRAVRVRSPFGKDALYVALTAPAGTGVASLEIEAGETTVLTRESYPYEFTLPDIQPDQTLRFRLKLTEPDGTTERTDWLKLPGTTALKHGE